MKLSECKEVLQLLKKISEENKKQLFNYLCSLQDSKDTLENNEVTMV